MIWVEDLQVGGKEIRRLLVFVDYEFDKTQIENGFFEIISVKRRKLKGRLVVKQGNITYINRRFKIPICN